MHYRCKMELPQEVAGKRSQPALCLFSAERLPRFNRVRGEGPGDQLMGSM